MSGLMGHSFQVDEGPVMCFNNAKNWDFGWYKDKHTTLNPLTQNFWSGNLVGYANYGTAPSDSSVIVKIEGHNKDFFVGFNHKTGINRQNQEVDAHNKVTIHSVGTSSHASQLEAKLGVGGTFEIPYFGGNDHAALVQVNKIDMNANPPIAQVTVSLLKCTSDADCDDASSCTTDTCNISTGTCLHTPNDVCSSFMKMVLSTDRYPIETSWKVVDNCNGDAIVMSGGQYKNAYKTFEKSTNVAPSKYTLVVEDAFGDGICCGQGKGSYHLSYNDKVVASGGKFSKSTSHTWGSCGTCDMPYELKFTSASMAGASWEIAFDKDPSKVAADNSGKQYSRSKTYTERGCLPSTCYQFVIKDVQSYSLQIDGNVVAGSNEYRNNEMSLFGTCQDL